MIEGEGQYLVMDFIQGEDLREQLERDGPLREDEVLPWFLQICDALAYLHNRKPLILHRDIKPGNIKIMPDGRAILVDFGLAKVVEKGGATTTGAKAMTPGFSPPEQYGTGRTDPRTDVYSLGATLYATLTAAIPEDALERAMGRVRADLPEETQSGLKHWGDHRRVIMRSPVSPPGRALPERDGTRRCAARALTPRMNRSPTSNSRTWRNPGCRQSSAPFPRLIRDRISPAVPAAADSENWFSC